MSPNTVRTPNKALESRSARWTTFRAGSRSFRNRQARRTARRPLDGVLESSGSGAAPALGQRRRALGTRFSPPRRSRSAPDIVSGAPAPGRASAPLLLRPLVGETAPRPALQQASRRSTFAASGPRPRGSAIAPCGLPLEFAAQGCGAASGFLVPVGLLPGIPPGWLVDARQARFALAPTPPPNSRRPCDGSRLAGQRTTVSITRIARARSAGTWQRRAPRARMRSP
jgi:hypothetical protein